MLLQTATNFGLINQKYPTDATFDPYQTKTQWQRFANVVSQLNQRSGPKVQYKLLFMGRHGEGYHNVWKSKSNSNSRTNKGLGCRKLLWYSSMERMYPSAS